MHLFNWHPLCQSIKGGRGSGIGPLERLVARQGGRKRGGWGQFSCTAVTPAESGCRPATWQWVPKKKGEVGERLAAAVVVRPPDPLARASAWSSYCILRQTRCKNTTMKLAVVPTERMKQCTARIFKVTNFENLYISWWSRPDEWWYRPPSPSIFTRGSTDHNREDCNERPKTFQEANHK